MKRLSTAICATLLSAATALAAQSYSSSSALVDPSAADGGGAVRPMRTIHQAPRPLKPFSRVAFSGGMSALGVSMSAATNLNNHMNLRGTGNVFNYTVNNFSTNGLNIGGKLNFATAGTAVDVYPWANHGFRLSTGALLYNQNNVTANIAVPGGTSFTLDNQTFYASSKNPIMGVANLALNTRKQAFTATTGWGNMIPRNGGHWSFPVEIGAAFTGAPKLNMAITQGQVCDQSGVYCTNVATYQPVQTALQAQVAKYTKDLQPLQTYPIVTFGVAYSFKTRSGR